MNGIWGKTRDLVPGVGLAVVVAGIAIISGLGLSQAIPSSKSFISPTLIAILLGSSIRFFVVLPGAFHPGISWGIKTILRAGIVFMGVRLSILSIFKIGTFAIGLVILCIGVAMLVALLLSKWAGISRSLAALIAAGTSICGVSAILSVAPAIDADQEEVSYAVVIITLVGLTATLIYPYLIEMVLGLGVIEAGYFIGTSVHDTSQVTATGLMYDQLWKHSVDRGLTSLDIALTTKLVRNTFMVFVIPIIAMWFRFKPVEGSKRRKMSFFSILPIFVLGYLGMSLLRTLGDLFFVQDLLWINFQRVLASISSYLMMVAVASIGLSTDFRKLRHCGMQPFMTGVLTSIAIAFTSYSFLRLFH